MKQIANFIEKKEKTLIYEMRNKNEKILSDTEEIQRITVDIYKI